MKFMFRFSNLLGVAYHKGNLVFTPDGNKLLSPVGNRVTLFDLKSNKTQTLPCSTELNLVTMDISPDGCLAIIIDEEGKCLLISLLSYTVLHEFQFNRPVNFVRFSPDGRLFAITKWNRVLLYYTPGKTKELNPFTICRTVYGPHDETVHVDWSSDSRLLCVVSRDLSTRIYGIHKDGTIFVFGMAGHSSGLISSFFEHSSADVYTVAANGMINVWQSTLQNDDFAHWHDMPPRLKAFDKDVEDDGASDQEREEEMPPQPSADDDKKKGLYSRIQKFDLKQLRGTEASSVLCTAAAYHKKSHILVTGFQDGVFCLHELPHLHLIHSLSLSNNAVSSVAINSTGDWIALGSSQLGHLVVWEWQSESYVLKQQGHFSNSTCVAYSPSGLYIASGGHDSKVKLWNVSNGFCVVTFSEHTAPITGVVFVQSGRAIISSSLDGTVRAFDMTRYRNFRTFTSPSPVQFSCLAVDISGDIVVAGGLDVFQVFVWSVKTGHLLEVLSGHEGPVSCLAFSPSTALLASSSWDRSVRLWDVFEHKGTREVIDTRTEALFVAFRPDGRNIAVITLDCHISFYDVESCNLVAEIEGRKDLGYSRSVTDQITAQKSSASKSFTSVCYSADGRYVLAAGEGKFVCIYSIANQILVKRFEITCNRSLDNVVEMLDRRKMTEFGSVDLVNTSEEKDISLPGARFGDLSTRARRPEIRVTSIQFSPTGREWVAASTEGLLIYSLDYQLSFDPIDLEVEITPTTIRQKLKIGEHSTALMMAFRLNELPLVKEIFEQIPTDFIDTIVESLPDKYVSVLLRHMATFLNDSPHVEFCLLWLNSILQCHGPQLKKTSANILSDLNAIQRILTKRKDTLGKMCESNKYTLQFLIQQSRIRRIETMSQDQNNHSFETLDTEFNATA